MQYRRLGRTGLKVSAISMGSWLTFSNSEEKSKAVAIIDRAYELGINFFDSSNSYDLGEAERFLGESLRRYPRESYVVTTKAYWPMGNQPNDYGLSRKHIFEQVHASLKRLGLEYIDIFYCHRFDPTTPILETLRTIDDLVRQGKILYVGVSEWTPAQLSEALQMADRYLLDRIVVNQPIYNMLNRGIESDMIPFGQEQGIAQVVFSPLAQGILTGKYKIGQEWPMESRARLLKSTPPPQAWSRLDVVNGKYRNGELRTLDRAPILPKINPPIHSWLGEDVLNKVEQLEHIAMELGITLTQLALAWVLRQPSVASAIIGASRPSQLEDNVKAADIILPLDILHKIENILS